MVFEIRFTPDRCDAYKRPIRASSQSVASFLPPFLALLPAFERGVAHAPLKGAGGGNYNDRKTVLQCARDGRDSESVPAAGVQSPCPGRGALRTLWEIEKVEVGFTDRRNRKIIQGRKRENPGKPKLSGAIRLLCQENGRKLSENY